MARDLPLLASATPAAVVPTEVAISHVQLRDLIICPREAGIVNYVQQRRIVEHDLKQPNSAPRPIAELDFTPNCLASLTLGFTGEDVLIAAGGQDADIHISYHTSGSSTKARSLKNVWSIDGKLAGSINNSVLLTTATSPSISVSHSNQSAIEPRIGVSNNDCTVRLHDIPLRGQTLRRIRRNEERLREAGILKLDVPINHSSISPDGQTLLSVGDSNKVYLHAITGGSRVSLSHISTYSLPSPDYSSIPLPSDSLVASFSTAFSGDGLKFAVASQEGVVAVWDVRSSKPLKVYHTEKIRPSTSGHGRASGWLSDGSPWEWGRGSARPPGWSVRDIKFGGSSSGKEVLTFTEHTSLIHVVDAQTFETHEILRMPIARPAPIPTSVSHPVQRFSATPSAPTRFLHPPATAPPASFRRTSRHQSFYSFPSPSPSPRRSSSPRRASIGGPGTPSIVHAVGDAFRVAYSPPESIGDSTWRTLHGLGASRSSPAPNANDNQPSPSRWQSELEDIVVIPPLGDTDEEGEEEGEIHALFRMHGMEDHSGLALDEHDDAGSSRWRRGEGVASGSGSGHVHSAMEVDELESDCASSRAPSRSSSPRPRLPFVFRNHSSRADDRGMEVDVSSRRGSESDRDDWLLYDDNLDLAGVCFDPTGKCLYVASTRSIAEWRVRGGEKGWWASDFWR